MLRNLYRNERKELNCGGSAQKSWQMTCEPTTSMRLTNAFPEPPRVDEQELRIQQNISEFSIAAAAISRGLLSSQCDLIGRFVTNITPAKRLALVLESKRTDVAMNGDRVPLSPAQQIRHGKIERRQHSLKFNRNLQKVIIHKTNISKPVNHPQ